MDLSCKNNTDIQDLLKPLESTIQQKFLPAISGQNAFNDADRDLMALPVCHGGLGIIDPSKQTAFQHETSKKITEPLSALILQKSTTCPPDTRSKQQRCKVDARKVRRQANKATAEELSRYTQQPTASNACEQRERSLQLALRLANRRARLCSTQRRLPRCLVPAIWLASSEPACQQPVSVANLSLLNTQ